MHPDNNHLCYYSVPLFLDNVSPHGFFPKSIVLRCVIVPVSHRAFTALSSKCSMLYSTFRPIVRSIASQQSQTHICFRGIAKAFVLDSDPSLPTRYERNLSSHITAQYYCHMLLTVLMYFCSIITTVIYRPTLSVLSFVFSCTLHTRHDKTIECLHASNQDDYCILLIPVKVICYQFLYDSTPLPGNI